MPATATVVPEGLSVPAKEARFEQPQHMRALDRANQVRLARAELKRAVSDGRVDICAVVMEPPAEAQGMAVMDLLLSQHRWGATRCRKLLLSIPLSEGKTIGSMTERQRTALTKMLQLGATRGRRHATSSRQAHEQIERASWSDAAPVAAR